MRAIREAGATKVAHLMTILLALDTTLTTN
jgi:hypothetical protein